MTAARKKQFYSEMTRKAMIVFFIFLGVFELFDFFGYVYQAVDYQVLTTTAKYFGLEAYEQADRLFLLLPISGLISVWSFWVASIAYRRYSLRLIGIMPAVFLAIYVAALMATIAVNTHTSALLAIKAAVYFALSLGAYFFSSFLNGITTKK